VYCFANLRKSKKVLKLKEIINQINKTEVKTYQDALIKAGFPICMSNKTDPFSKSNYLSTIALGYELNKLKNGLFIQTKGGQGIDDFLKAINYKKNIVWYITITTLNELIRKRIEPGAPTSEERFLLAKKLKDMGYLVVIALNPVLENWLPENDLINYMNKCKELNIKHICIEPLHLNKNEINNITGMEKSEIDYATDRKAYAYQSYAKKIIPIFKNNGFHIIKIGNALPTEFFNEIRKVFGKIFPNQYDLINYCKNKIKSGIITFDLFYNLSVDDKAFFEIDFKQVNKYILKANIHEWAKSNEAKNIFSLKGVLQYIWNNPNIQSSMSRNKAFRIVINDNGEYLFDENKNLLLYYDGNIYTKPNRKITYKNCNHEKY